MGAAHIARKNWLAILHSGTGVVTAVASRDEGRARRFIEECQSDAFFPEVPRAVGGYEGLLARDDVDAVYIPLPTGLRKEWVLKAAAAGKHVLSEKPCGVTAAETEEMVQACARHGVQFMDGVMFMHSGRLPRLREILDDGESVGRVKRVTSQFSFLAPDDFFTDNIRAHGELEPLGCLGDLGWYCVRFSLWVQRGRMPKTVSGRLLAEAGRNDSPRSVPTEFSGEMVFEDGVSAGFYCSFLTELQQWANISGTKGYALIPDFVLPYAGSELGIHLEKATYTTKGCWFSMDPTSETQFVEESSHGLADAQESRMFRAFNDAVLSGKPRAEWPAWSVKTQRVLDACLASAREGGRSVEVGG